MAILSSLSNEALYVFHRYPILLLLGVVLGCGDWSPASAKEAAAYVDEARAYLGKQDLKAAEIQLKNALQQEPGNVQARLLLGQLYLRQGNAIAAEKELQQVRTLDAAGGEWRLPLANAYLAQGKYEPLIQDIALLPQDSPATRASLIAMAGLAELGLQRFDAADNRFSTALRVDPGNVDALTGAARLAVVQDKDYATAATFIDRALQSDPGRPEIWVYKGELGLLQQRYPESLEAYQRALELQPDNLFALLGRAQINSLQGKWDQALADIDKVEQTAAQLPSAHYLRAQALFNKKDLQGAQEAAEQVLKIAPDDPNTLLLLGYVYFAQNQINQADQVLTRLIQQQPQHLPARKLLAAAKLQLDQPAQAIEVLNPALAQAPQDRNLLILLGSAYMQNKEHEKGSAYIKRAADLQPDSGQLRNWLAMQHLGIGRLDQAAGEMDAAQALGNKNALIWLEQAVERDPQYVGAGLLLISQYLQYQENAKALAVAERLHQAKPDDLKVLRALALARLANGDIAGALPDLRRLTAAQPQAAEAWHALALAQLRAGDRQAAAVALARTLSLQNDFLPALLTRIQLNLQEKRYAAALQDARFLQDHSDNPALGYRLEGDIYRQQGDLAKAVAAYKAAYERAPDGRLALALAATQDAQGEQQAAVATLRQWLSRQPRDIAVRFQLAGYLTQLQRSGEALIEYERIVELAPDNVDALNNLAWLYQQAGSPRALTMAEKAAQLAPERPEIVDTLGWILVQNNQPERGAGLLAQAVAQAPQVLVIRYHLAVAYAKAGQRDKARQELQKLLNSGTVFEEQNQARALLDSLQ